MSLFVEKNNLFLPLYILNFF